MDIKCDQCEQPAIYHCVELVNQWEVERHWCQQYAVSQGIDLDAPHLRLHAVFAKLCRAKVAHVKIVITALWRRWR